MAYNVYDNWERLVKKVLHEEKLRRDAFREFSRLSVSSSFSSSSSSSSFRQEGYRKPGNIISKGHKNYDLMLKSPIGLSTARYPSSRFRELRASDFDPKLNFWHRFPPEGSKHTPPHQSVEFLWKDYCPMVFRNLREMFKLDLYDYLLSIYVNDGLREISSPGKSGSFFYLTPDDRFMIKRVKKSEIKVLLKILPFYYSHIQQMLDNTLLTKFYGAYCYKQVGGMKARFVVMDNLFYSKYQIHRRFDLKGSSYGRFSDGKIDETTTLKDLDLRYAFRLQPHTHKILMKQIDLDCEFLEAQSLMDYSLVLGIHFCDDNNTDNIMGNVDSYQSLKFPGSDSFLAEGKALVNLGANMPARVELMSARSDFEQYNSGSSQSGGISEVIIYLGISGILQDYDISKKLERAYKSLQVDPTSISAVDPKLYSKRFRDVLGRVFLEDNL